MDASKRFKMYKSGKQWEVAGLLALSFLGVGISSNNHVHADQTIPTAQSTKSAQNTQQSQNALTNQAKEKATTTPTADSKLKQDFTDYVTINQKRVLAVYTQASADIFRAGLATAVKTTQQPTLTDDQIYSGYDALNNGISQLQIDASNLANYVNQAKAIDLSNYTQASRDNFTTKVNTLANLAKNAQNSVTLLNAINAVRDAQAALTIDHTIVDQAQQLQDYLHVQQNRVLAVYTDYSASYFNQQLDKAVNTYHSINRSMNDINQSYDQVNDGIANLRWDSQKLANYYNTAIDAQTWQYTKVTAQPYKDAAYSLQKLAEAKADSGTLVTAVNRLRDTQASLVTIPSEIQLVDYIHQLQNIDLNHYTKDSGDAFNDKLYQIVDFYHADRHSDAQNQDAINQLTTAKNSLVKSTGADSTTRNNLLTTIRQAQDVHGWLYRNYTYQNMNNVLAKAVDVYHNQDADNTTVNQNNAELKQAISGLILAYNRWHDNDYSAQFLAGARQNSFNIGGKTYNFKITDQANTHSYGRTNFVAAGCTENALANAMKLAGLLPDGFKVSDVAAKAWNIQTGGLDVSQGVTRYNQQSLGSVGDYAAVSMSQVSNVIAQTNQQLGLFSGQQNFIPVGSTYFGYGLGYNKGVMVANQIQQWRSQGYFVTLLVRAAGTNDSADHAVTVLSMDQNFRYGDNINVLDSYHGVGSYNGLAQGLSNMQKVQYAYKAIAYKAVDWNGNQIWNQY